MYREYNEETKQNRHMEIESKYDIGGQDYFSYKDKKRGLYLIFSLVTMTKRDGYTSVEFTPMANSNFRYFIKEMKRKSAKQEDKLNNWLKDNEDEIFNAYDLYLKGEDSDIRIVLDKIENYMAT